MPRVQVLGQTDRSAQGGGHGSRQRHLLHLADVALQLLTSSPQLLALLLQPVARLLQPLIHGHIGSALLVESLPLGLRVLCPPREAWGVWGWDTAHRSARGRERTQLIPSAKHATGGHGSQKKPGNGQEALPGYRPPLPQSRATVEPQSRLAPTPLLKPDACHSAPNLLPGHPTR